MIFIFVFAKTFKIINGKLSETYIRANYKVGSLEEKSILKALMIQELRRYIATPIYIFNTAFAMVLLVAASVVSLFLSREQILVLLGYQGMEDLIPMMALVLMIFTIGLSCTTNSSISFSLYLFIIYFSSFIVITIYHNFSILQIQNQSFYSILYLYFLIYLLSFLLIDL